MRLLKRRKSAVQRTTARLNPSSSALNPLSRLPPPLVWEKALSLVGFQGEAIR